MMPEPDHELMMIEKPRRGRPKMVTGRLTSPVCVRLTEATYDKLCSFALKHDIDVSDLIREAIEMRLVFERRATPR